MIVLHSIKKVSHQYIIVLGRLTILYMLREYLLL